jgi:hypothetical protein
MAQEMRSLVFICLPDSSLPQRTTDEGLVPRIALVTRTRPPAIIRMENRFTLAPCRFKLSEDSTSLHFIADAKTY